MIVLGIDTSLRSSGGAVVESKGSRLVPVEFGPLRTPPKRPVSECLTRLAGGLREIIARTNPTAAGIEGAFYFKNARTAMMLGQARGVAIAVCSELGIPVYEYAPRRVKQAIVGYGGASKEQVRRMVMSLLALDKEPQEDAGDALALAICHINSTSGHEALAPKAI